MTSPEGKLHFHLQWQGNRPIVRIESTRPLQACRVFEQSTVGNTLKRLPLLFSICGQAQSVASVRAIESAQSNFASDAVELHRNLLVSFESLREHLWRMLLDWPSLAGQAPLTSVLSPIHQEIMALQNQINPDGRLCQEPGLAVTAINLASLYDQWRMLRTQVDAVLQNDTDIDSLSYAIRMLESMRQLPWEDQKNLSLEVLPTMSVTDLAAVFENVQDFIAFPEWSGRVFETGPYARQRNHPHLIQTREQHGHGVYTRLLARVIEISQLLDSITDIFQGLTVAEVQRGEMGIAQVEAVRGRLIHAIELEGDRIHSYRILAPTEWNFHPRGIAVQLLSSLDKPELLEQQAAWIIQAIDPCVGYDMTVSYGAG